MSNNLVKNFLEQIGLSSDEVSIYLTLLTKGEMTVLELSRHIKLERTKVYRTVEGMKDKALIIVKIEDNKKFLHPCSVEVIQRLAENEVIKSNFISTNLNSFLVEIKNIESSILPTKVKHYKGHDGIKQVLWNELKAKSEILTYSYRILDEVVGKKFFRDWSREIDFREIEVKDLRSFQFLKSEIEAKGRVIMPFKNDNIRYLKSEVLDFEIEMDIYNDTVVIFNWIKSDVFAVEIVDKNFAIMQKSIFMNYWNIAEPVTALEWVEMMREYKKMS